MYNSHPIFSRTTSSTLKLRHALLIPALVLLFIALHSVALATHSLATPEDKVLLTINGKITHHNVDDTLQLDLTMLESFEPITFTTETIWLDEATTFTGVRLSDLLEYAGARSTKLRAEALDKYWYEFKDDNWQDFPVIVAYKKNGEYMSVKELGPLWIMYPFDDFPQTLTEDNQGACVWQLLRLTLL